MKKRKALRRENHEGNIQTRADGRHMLQVQIDGKRKTFYGKTNAEVIAKRNAYQRDIADGVDVASQGQTCGAFFTSWLGTIKHTTKERTYETYSSYIRLHTEPIRTIPISKLTPQQVQDLYTAKTDSGLSRTTVQHLHAILHVAFDAAVRLGVMPRNVSDLTRPPTMQQHAEYTTLSVTQARQLLKAAQGDPYEALFVLELSTGMRLGEVLGLKWDAVDLDKGHIKVIRNLQWRGGGARMETPKRASSRRTIQLTDIAVTALRKHQEQQREQQQAMGIHWDTTQHLVFTNTVGRPVHNSYFQMNTWKPLLKKAGLPDMRFHDLRHTCATLLLEAGVHIKVVSELLGHASITITLQLYSHVSSTMHQSAAVSLNQLLTTPVKTTVTDSTNEQKEEDERF